MRHAAAIEALERALPGRCRRAQALAACCTWRIGGPAELFVVPETVDELRAALDLCIGHELPWRLIGAGSNLLFPDEGLPGAVIRLGQGFAGIAVKGRLLQVGAAAPAGSLCRRAAEAGLAGLEFAIGIPAWLGGMLRMNAGAHGGEMAGVVRRVLLLPPGGEPRWRDARSLGFHYRGCEALERGIALQAELELQPEGSAAVRERTREYNEIRRRMQPLTEASCGSVFKRPPGDYPGRLIEAAGCKGLSVGGIRVSEKHANFFVNTGGGRAVEVLELVAQVKAAVREHSGVMLEEEFRHVR
jgi:UDP-N-acetylmuramate dehydrogenase